MHIPLPPTHPPTHTTPTSTPHPQVVGFLYNNGTAEICDLKLKPVNAPGLSAFWPDWAGAGASYERFFNLKQMTAVGMTTVPNVDGTLPTVEVVSMRPCTEGEVAPVTTLLLTRKIAIEDSPMLPPAEAEMEAEATAPAGVAGMGRRALQANAAKQELTFAAPLEAQECAVYQNGTAILTLCLESVSAPSGSLTLVKGFLYNNGSESACNVRVRAVNAPGLIEQWPEWSPTSAYEKYFNPKQVTSVGMTSKPNIDGSLPSLEVVSFHTCGSDAAHGALAVRKTPLADVELPPPEVEVAEVINHGLEQKRQLAFDIHPTGEIAYKLDASPDKAQKAFKPGYDVTLDPDYQDGVEVPPLRDDYEICKRFDSYDPNLEVTVCLENAKTWHDKKRGRIVSTGLSVINTGSIGLCNMTVYIEGMENELEHFPQLIDDNGFDTYPKFVSWYAPGRVTNMGSAIPKAKGVPRFTVLKNFVACDEPDSNIVRRKFRCTESTRKPNAAVKICVYSDLKEWSDDDGARIVSVDGFISNTGGAPLCNLTVDISNFENARAYWGDWMPTFPYYLDESSTLKFAANIPYEKGFPKVSLKKYAICPHKVEEPKIAVPKEESVAANTKKPAAAAVPATPEVDPLPALVPPATPAVEEPAVAAGEPAAEATPAVPAAEEPAVVAAEPAVVTEPAPVVADAAAAPVEEAPAAPVDAPAAPVEEAPAAPVEAPAAEVAARRLRST